MDALALWLRYRDLLCTVPSLGIKLDVSRVDFPADLFDQLNERMQGAFAVMADLEAGEIANPDEDRMVGHYWLRSPNRGPTDEAIAAIEQAQLKVRTFAAAIHEGEITPPMPEGADKAPAKFTDVLLIGIGGSALGPMLLDDALGSKRDKMTMHYLDNTDPDGIDRTPAGLGARVKSTLVLVVSKSGGTPETRNGMLETQAFFQQKGLDFSKQAVAITTDGSKLHQLATEQGWLETFPMWDWVGGRTSVTSAVGLLPAALQGLDIDELLAGAAAMDEVTREQSIKRNPAALLAAMWHHCTNGRGEKDMVMLPYKDRLILFSRYLQQLIMESLGKKYDFDGNEVNQGIAVYGNKGSTDQHAYVQQLREGVNNFFVTFIVVLNDRSMNAAKKAPDVEEGVTSGDYLHGFWQGTRQALYEEGRSSITITVNQLDAKTLGALIALYERAVGLYASVVNINAYHQPGVEAGKKAAAAVISLQRDVVKYLQENADPVSAEQLADRMGRPQDVEAIHHLLQHLLANKRGVAKTRNKFRWKG